MRANPCARPKADIRALLLEQPAANDSSSSPVLPVLETRWLSLRGNALAAFGQECQELLLEGVQPICQTIAWVEGASRGSTCG